VVAGTDHITLGTFPDVNVTLNLTGTSMVADAVPVYLNPVPQNLRTIDMKCHDPGSAEYRRARPDG
jgi:hypothetical protein